MSVEVFLMILGMALVTYVPRALPALLLAKMNFPPRFERFLRLIPYTAMTALVFPGIFYLDAERWYIGAVGAATAGALAWKKLPLVACVLAAVLAVFVLNQMLA